MFDARPGARAATAVLVVTLFAVLALRQIHLTRAEGAGDGRHASVRGPGRAGAPADAVASTSRHDRIAVYRGLGTWIDIYDVAWRHPRRAVHEMAREGIRTLYLQTSNFDRGRPFVYRAKVARFLDAADRVGIDVVAWYLPGFRDVGLDLHRSLAAIRFRTARGNAFDSYALDIESPAVRRPGTRTRRLLALSSRLRRAVGPEYALGAIIPSPRALNDSAAYWPRFPFRALERTYDVLLPMTYFTWRVRGERGAHRYTAQNIAIIRRETKDPGVPIHVIGGIGPTRSETRGFVDAVRERGVIGASYYTFPITPSDDWEPLRQVTPIPDPEPALPVAVGYPSALGNVPGVDSTHPREVVFKVGGRRGRYLVSFQAYDIQAGEVMLLVNWHRVAELPAGSAHGWGPTSTIAIPPALLERSSTNYIAFAARGTAPDWPTWGVRSVRLVRPGAAQAT